MATYNKRGFKAPKPEEEKVVVEQPVEETTFDGNSTTAEVFNKLDEGANKTEEWVAKNQKAIFGVVGAIALLTIGYLAYDKLIADPKQDDAANDMFQAEQYYNSALSAPTPQANDSLFNLALKGGEGKFGLLAIIENHAGTDAANLAHYHAGVAYLNTGKYKEAVEHLEQFKTDDEVLKAQSKGLIGDAYVQLNKKEYQEKGLSYYEEAAKASTNEAIAPYWLNKAAKLSLYLGKNDEALTYFKEIKEKYSTSQEAGLAEAYIAKLEK
jgi:tetratricopeptide (TPR) repeat protein